MSIAVIDVAKECAGWNVTCSNQSVCVASVGSVAVRNAEQKSMKFSASLSETAPRVLSLQRDCLRSIPWIKRAYGIRLSESVR